MDTRWQSVSGGTVNDSLIDEMAGVRFLSGTGILPSQATGNAREDVLHDSASNAFLFASVGFEAISSGDAVLSLATGDGLIVDDGVSLNPTFRTASISVRAVPEPSSLNCLLILMSVVLSKRVRN